MPSWSLSSNNRIYFSLRPVKKIGRSFNFIFGGRGTGKTFNSLYEEYEDDNTFALWRRTQTEVDLLGSGTVDVSMNPFESINIVKGTQLFMKRVNKYVWGVYDNFDEPRHVGFVMGLSTIGNIRGFSGDVIQDVIYDEFIPQKNARSMSDESGMFFNAYETVNRNRELDGRAPLRVFLLTNSNTLSHPLLYDLGLIPKIEKMKRKGITFMDLPQRDCTLTMIDNAEFKEKKAKTALYRLTKGTSYYDMAIENDFAYDDLSAIKSMPLVEFVPVCCIQGVTIYKHKSGAFYYVSPHYQKCEVYSDSESDISRFRTNYARVLYVEYENNNVFFENYVVKRKFLEVINA